MPVHLPPISRRQFLAGAVATGTGLLLPRQLWAADRRVDENRWTLLADIHINGNRDFEAHGLKPTDQFAKARAQILRDSADTSGIIVAGDCACSRGLAGDYTVLRELVQPLREAGLPVHFALGNHDDRPHFWAAFPPAALSPIDRHVSILETPHANWFLVDSLVKPGYVPGRLGEVQLKWLATALDARPNKPALVLAHHDLNSGKNSLEDAKELLEVLSPRKHVKAYLYGHTHCWNLSKRGDIHLVNIPTVVWTPDDTQPRAWLDARLRPDGMTLTVHALEKDGRANGQTVDLAWRT